MVTISFLFDDFIIAEEMLMSEISTDELNKILKSTHVTGVDAFLSDNKESLITSDRPFCDYMREKIHENGLRQQDIFLDADISEKYGYKLLSEEKRTRQRDVILRICYASGLNLDETQKALRLYRMPELYSKIKRDALLMIAFNERPGDIISVNAFLKKNGVDILRSCGTQE